ncbi:bifunctional hydroxymethylpyrimidine kinase/phosphomethylpyrimidine kinase [Mucilaginibacter paludis]|uniref:hydroxymethylpyrimidine kinase n=1 Tax=Mucilaginibacter paludis DSM 18603 TaxID=714943 RepID=H1Y3N2_9SPHI|nr:bifunctional hydroxymethylpyrimidine kinase/phosphomethylpyrimidine kinase [Mucilaginibacter paludis]EHQ30294.1 phosphomethylpyrimidine kinase [Mucilaginibacter paludis DSM 18603]
MKKFKYTSVLTIAGSDSGGGAGIQADLKTFAALGCYGTSAITAITVQNTLGVTAIHSIPPEIVAGQITAVMDDIKPLAIKIGMIHSAELALAIATTLKNYPHIPVVLDPVMVATSGDQLIEHDTIGLLKKELFPLATLLTPNLDETALLTGKRVNNVTDMQNAAAELLKKGCKAVLIKGGHLQGDTLYNFYLDQNADQELFSSVAVQSRNTHGTGCTLSSAIAAFLARGNSLKNAIIQAQHYIHQAIEQGAQVVTGQGHGPVNHFFNPQIAIQYELE